MTLPKLGTSETIAFDSVGKYDVSTIYTTETWNGEPRYETAVFDTSNITIITPFDWRVARVVDERNYATREQALAGHRELVEHYELET